MPRTVSRFSLFSQPLDRALFVAYFLGAVLPLLVLAYLIQARIIPAFPEARTLYVALMVSVAVLSLGSFLALRRSARQALTRLDRDNQQLGILLEASRSLVRADHDREVMRSAVRYATQLTGGAAALFLIPRGSEGLLEAVESTGRRAEEIFQQHRQALGEVAHRAASQRRPAAWRNGRGNGERGGNGPGAAGGRAGGQRALVGATAVPCSLGASGTGALVVLYDAATWDGTGEGDRDSLATLAGLATVALQNTDLKEAQRNFFTHVTHMLVGALDAHLTYKGDHSSNVARLAVSVGREVGMDEEHLERLHHAALLHDIGMLEIDREQVGNRNVVQKHPGLGAEMLQRIQIWEDLAPMVLHHHEWYDGSGYPEGKAAEEIPLESRVIGLVEAFDSMTNLANYQNQISVPEALERIEQGAGTQFDPRLVKVLLDLAHRGALEG